MAIFARETMDLIATASFPSIKKLSSGFWLDLFESTLTSGNELVLLPPTRYSYWSIMAVANPTPLKAPRRLDLVTKSLLAAPLLFHLVCQSNNPVREDVLDCWVWPFFCSGNTALMKSPKFWALLGVGSKVVLPWLCPLLGSRNAGKA
ncbi:conserved hypothetical protein [Mycoplasmoides pneumoniae M129]|uniref:Uncharacterized protein MPN_486 n=2 Tax=Mycoplasmoides pneumoniae TaxID=2104 RepID=Y486_MYCPN|nr:RecName: Full=Uncharacterized protein MPN_486 [Mycoplasmoides pneumoniae M129]AAB96004.1 conserved hypothetical protein [Mycoplasmoides pneumoniae M129]BAL22063.1 hypothetical protein MPNA4860 [Mycoplasmoides pneumoniae 309]BAV19985.1 hypothetical protein MPNB_4860 [Mycoplasmoides pneumoniae]BAV20723.1 hypothetical protein MPNC_4860 [Mycoplasmoides pneumoniae]